MLENPSIDMLYKEKYVRPVVTDSVELALENAILGASVVDAATRVTTAPQEVENISGTDFNSTWEE